MSQHDVTDAGRRLSEHVTLAQQIGGTGRWIAARLSDGKTDGKVYDTKADAVRHQVHETQSAYMVVPPTAMPPGEATAWLALNRRVYDAGFRLSDPDGPTPVMPHTRAGLAAALRDMTNRASRRAAMRRHPAGRGRS